MRLQVSLLDMPELPMSIIMDYCDFPAILNLLKTCHSFRDYIKTHKPLPQITQIGFSNQRNQYICNVSRTEHVFVMIVFDIWHDYCLHPMGGMFKMYYYKMANGCEVVWERSVDLDTKEERKIFLENEDFIEAFSRDLKIILEIQKFPIKDFTFWGGPGLSGGFHKAMQSNIFQAHRISFRNSHQHEIMEYLQHFCPKTLEAIYINCHDDVINGVKKPWMTISEVTKSEQWKGAMRVGMTIPGPYLAPIEDFGHLEKGYVNYRRIGLEHVKVMKEAFLSSNSLTKSFCLMFYECPDQEEIKRFLDPTLQKDRYLYRRPHHPCQIVSIQFMDTNGGYKQFEFSVMDIKNITEPERRSLPPIEVDANRILRGLMEELEDDSGKLEEKKIETPPSTTENPSCLSSVNRFFSRLFYGKQ
ncbi:hypothetical protein CAEBREN_03150 [Caenorhabditis brenneri]|uniref:F-box domain-containing protein n=1 Tax=Caenorhabditis brenneri TaxID=135651 RepID=G0N1I0_CAEBE|nr:hypothetical protein CAEBREN_03150 [Caenorhabditis brenneri]